jgi:hypothetical protein
VLFVGLSLSRDRPEQPEAENERSCEILHNNLHSRCCFDMLQRQGQENSLWIQAFWGDDPVSSRHTVKERVLLRRRVGLYPGVDADSGIGERIKGIARCEFLGRGFVTYRI